MKNIYFVILALDIYLILWLHFALFVLECNLISHKYDSLLDIKTLQKQNN